MNQHASGRLLLFVDISAFWPNFLCVDLTLVDPRNATAALFQRQGLIMYSVWT